MERQFMMLMITLIVVLVVFPTSGCLDGDSDDRPDHGPPPPFPERTELELVDGHMTTLEEWFANVSVQYVWSEEAYRVEEMGFFDSFHPLGSPKGPYYQYFDQDDDGYISGGDYIHFTNLTNFHYDNGFNMSSNGEPVAYFELNWDKEEHYNYLLLSESVTENVANPGFWTVNISFRVRTPGLKMSIHEFNLGYLSRDGVALPTLSMEFQDRDGDGFVSTGDEVRLTEVTRGYHRCQVQFVYYTQLVGFDWIFLPGA